MKVFALLLVVVTSSAFVFLFQPKTDDVIVTETPKGYSAPRPIVHTSWEDAIPKFEPKILAIKDPPPPMPAVPAPKAMQETFSIAKAKRKPLLSKYWKPPHRYRSKTRRLTRIGHSRSG